MRVSLQFKFEPATLAITGPSTNFDTFHAVFAAEPEAEPEAKAGPEPELEEPHWAPDDIDPMPGTTWAGRGAARTQGTSS